MKPRIVDAKQMNEDAEQGRRSLIALKVSLLYAHYRFLSLSRTFMHGIQIQKVMCCFLPLEKGQQRCLCKNWARRAGCGWAKNWKADHKA